ncbi:SDR family NAD(P)-dependent oxidoreductase [Iodobacter sp. LRB]|uniref:SDR family NAD(P)-dependent oxidoreductase n=1 Tax=unclassified Iodobacter TaxID=235634 RepID=UPI000C0CF879|nr:SDR family NAD(P)-dependent oxidoreductase [Iodobacter sp. BJB302]PHV03472.1 3-oxoacyl-ACP reductase [Iodobacter sp. BJB302]
MLLQNNIALVTGAAKGIGFAVSYLFAMQGAHVFMTGRNMNALTLAKDKILVSFPEAKVSVIEMDVTNADSVRNAFQQIFKQTKRLDILVSNAGILDDALIGMVTPSQLQHTFETNTFGVIYCAQYASRLMARNKRGSIINLASIIGTNGNIGQTVYAASKSAVIGVTKSLSKELAAQNIRVNAIAPGFIDTDMARSIGESKYQERLDSIAMGRIGSAEEVAQVALFLASDLASYVTGQTIGVDGGMLI